MSKLYLRLYLFAVIIMATSGLISSYVIDLVYRNNRPPGPPPEVIEQVRDQVALFKTLLPAEPKAADDLLHKLAIAQNWDLSIWRGQQMENSWGGPPPAADLALKLEQGQAIQQFWVAIPLGQRWLLIHPKPPMRGPPPVRNLVLPFLMTTLILMVLLIPFVRRIVQPFKHLMASIRRVSVGNYETQLQLRPGSEFEDLADEFNHMMTQIQKTLAEKQRLIADVSHELRSPLARLRLSLELMAKKGDVPEKYFNRAVAEVEQLDALIDDLLDASRLELRSHFAPQTTEMSHFIQFLLDKNQLLFTDQGMEVQFQHPEQVIWCDIDRDLMERAINNLISNTLKYARPTARLHISLADSVGAVELRFRDNGPGVAEADCTRIFDPFYRTDDSRTRSTGGVGLGLSIVRKIIQLHRGEVWAQLPVDGQGGLLIGMRLPALVVNPGQTGQLV